MNVLIVVNNLNSMGNGIALSVSKLAEALKDSGMNIRVLACRNAAKDGPSPDYQLPRRRDFFADFFKKNSGYYPAAATKSVIRDAVRWADVVHLAEPFTLQERVCDIAEAEGKPLTASYNIHPENITALVRMQGFSLLNALVVKFWNRRVYNRCRYVMCPNENIREFLEKKKVKAELAVVEGGTLEISADAVQYPLEKKPSLFYIVSTGRLSVEKSQETLLLAMEHSKHKARIKLIFAGKGPKLKALKDTAENLRRSGAIMREPLFRDFTLEELKGIYSIADLYVDTSFAEADYTVCADAVSNGIVPVIAEGKRTAATKLALNPMSLFPAGDARKLAKCIDYWYEHEEERRDEALKYKNTVQVTDIRETAKKMREIFSLCEAGEDTSMDS